MLRPSSLPPTKNTLSFSAGSWQFAICSVRGSFCSFAHLPGRNTCCGLFTRRGPMLLRRKRWWTEPGCFWQTEGWGCGALRGTRSAHTGPVGPVLPTILERHLSTPTSCAWPCNAVMEVYMLLQRPIAKLFITSGFDCPGRLRGLQPGQVVLDDLMLGIVRRRWQRGAAVHVEEHFRTAVVWPHSHHRGQALLRSQSGFFGRCPVQLRPVCCSVRFFRGLWCPLPLSASSCQCGRPSFHHRVVCLHAGVWTDLAHLTHPEFAARKGAFGKWAAGGLERPSFFSIC